MRIISLSCCIALISLLPLVAGMQGTAGECAPIGDTETTIDLSYLHRCGEGEIATAIQGRIEEQKLHPEPNKKSILDIDLTASLIGKNISGVLSSLKWSDETQNDENAKDESSVLVKLTARRNRLSAEKVTAVLDFVLENGPSNQTDTIAAGGVEEDKENSEETTSLIAEEAESANNKARTNASAVIDDAPKEDSDSNNGQIQDEATTLGSEQIEATEETSTTMKLPRIRPAFVSIQSLDLGWNNMGSSSGSRNSVRGLNTALRKLLANSERCPPTIKLDVCGLGPQACRELAKGIVERYKTKENEAQPLTLNLACNEGIGDVGVAALAAAIRTVASPQKNLASNDKKKKRRKRKKSAKQESLQEDEKETTRSKDSEEEEKSEAPDVNTADSNASNESSSPDESATESEAKSITVLEKLDLSGCGIGDAGAEALAIALANNPLCVKHLDLSNNKISDQGAAALAQALGTAARQSADAAGEESRTGFMETLDLSHNKELGDAGAKKLALAFQNDGISRLIVRSCNVRADGAASFGTALRSLGLRPMENQVPRLIDLSGNPLGVLSKKKKSGNKYSATALRSKATDTTKAYMNIIGKSLQKGLNSINGVAIGDGMDTLESDDEEEGRMGETEEEDDSRKKCGALSLAEAFIRDGFEEAKNTGDEIIPLQVELGLRHCSFDTRAAEALAAVLHESKEHCKGMKLSMDMAMNHVLEDDIIAALHGEEGYDDQLADMAEVYLDALEVMREARERALEASRMASARAKAEAEREAAWGAPPPSSQFRNDYGEEWSDEDEYEHWDDSIPGEYEGNLEEEDYSDEEW